MHTVPGLNHALLLDGQGGAQHVEASNPLPLQGSSSMLWLDFNYTDTDAASWVEAHTDIPEVVVETMFSEESRPRATAIDDNLLAALRGINHAPEEDPEDMVSIRIWANAHLLITTHRRKLLSIQDAVDALHAGHGAQGIAELLVDIIDRLVMRTSAFVEVSEDQIDAVEELFLRGDTQLTRETLAELRRQILILRRHLAPQREALAHLQVEKLSWLQDVDRLRLRECSDQLIRCIEDLDTVRDRGSMTHEELVSELSDNLNRRMYTLAIVTTIFLPLGFLTGLLGINVGGIPGSDNPQAFWYIVLVTTVIIMLQLFFLRRKNWF